MYLSPKKLKLMLNFYPPYIGAGIRIKTFSDDWKLMIVNMKLRWYNRNAVGSHFGGSLYSMVDPHIMLMLMQLLGKNYIVWDKSAKIEYVSAVRGEVTAKIILEDSDIEEIKKQTADGVKYLPQFEILITDKNGELVAKVQKTLYIKKKNKIK